MAWICECLVGIQRGRCVLGREIGLCVEKSIHTIFDEERHCMECVRIWRFKHYSYLERSHRPARIISLQLLICYSVSHKRELFTEILSNYMCREEVGRQR